MNCVSCNREFEILQRDKDFYKKIAPVFDGVKHDLPLPEECPDCRMQRRMAFRNQNSLYKRKSSKSGQTMIATFRDDTPFPVYSYDEWLADDWDPRDYGRDFDFERPFFEQFKELWNSVPQPGLVFQSNINCDFCNIVGNCKNCYLIYGSVECEDCYYGNPYKCRKCVDTYLVRESELCLECVDCKKLYNCCGCQNCSNSSDLMFCFEVNNSKNCFGCAGLNRKEYCVFNVQKTKEEYNKFVQELDLTNREVLADVQARFEEIKRKIPHKYYVGHNNEDVSGDYIFNSKDCFDVYGVDSCRDCSYSFQLLKANDCHDVAVGEYGEMLYEISAFYDRLHNVLFSFYCWVNVRDVFYSGYCNQDVSNCFGCIGLKRAEYCILNKQYSAEEYPKMVNKIIEQMKATGEWGRPFPASMSVFAYNETIANEFYPLSKEEVLQKGWKWYESDVPQGDRPGDAAVCEITGKSFRILPQEKEIYQHFGVALPLRCPQQRHLDRVNMRNPLKLNDRSCDQCGMQIKSTYGLEREEKVYCEKCYQQLVY